MKNAIPAQKEKIIDIACDRCGMKCDGEDVLEAQEFLSFSDVAGYGNRNVGDGRRWSIDLCQDCTRIVLGQYIQIHR